MRALRELGRRARDRRVSTFVVFDTHWLSNFGYHVNANPRHHGSFTSHEAPQIIQDLRVQELRLGPAPTSGRERGTTSAFRGRATRARYAVALSCSSPFSLPVRAPGRQAGSWFALRAKRPFQTAAIGVPSLSERV